MSAAMKILSDAQWAALTDAQLEAELERRKQKREEEERPKPVVNPDWSKLIRTCDDVIKECERGEHEDSDLPHYVYEEAMRAIYGPDVFKWMNKR